MPLQPNVEEVPSQDEEEMYQRLMDQTAQTTPAETTSAPPRKVTPDVVIEVEGTQEARERGHVVIAIENADPDLEVQIVVRTKRAGLLLVSIVVGLISVELKYKRHGSVMVGDESAVKKKGTCRSIFLTNTEIKRNSTCTCMSNLI